jgi:hypothetical protein
MKETIFYTSYTERSHDLRNLNVLEDGDFIMEHLNDPNFDLSRAPSLISLAKNSSTKEYVCQNDNVEPQFESDRYSTSRVESRDSMGIDLEESELFYLPFIVSFLTAHHSDSPYPEVQTAVSTVDDPLMPVNTFRMWFLGILFVLLTSGFNQVLYMRCMPLSDLAHNTI